MKKTISQMATGKIMKKYNVMTLAKSEIKISNTHGIRDRKHFLTTRTHRKIDQLISIRDDVRRLTAGIKTNTDKT